MNALIGVLNQPRQTALENLRDVFHRRGFVELEFSVEPQNNYLNYTVCIKTREQIARILEKKVKGFAVQSAVGDNLAHRIFENGFVSISFFSALDKAVFVYVLVTSCFISSAPFHQLYYFMYNFSA